MELSWLRPLKGILIFITFLGIGISFQVQPNIGVLGLINMLQISPGFVTLAFWLSGFMSLITGLLRWNWNAFWIAVFIFYTISAWVAAAARNDIPVAAPFAYSLLSALLILDVVIDIIRGNDGRNTKKR